MALRVADLEVLFTANVDDVEKAEKSVRDLGQKVEGKPIEQKIDANAKPALESMDRVESEAKKLVSNDTAVKIDANIERAEKGIERTEKSLEYLRSIETEVDVKADISRAEARLQKLTRQRDSLTRAREQITVDANTIPAEEKLDEVEDVASESGEDAGENLGEGIISALKTIPIAGAVVGIAAAVGKAVFDGFNSGLQQEVTRDRLQALTGISDAEAARFARAAAEAYANTFGESIEANMDTSRLALQFNILDETSTTRDAQLVVQSLSGIADVLGEDVQPVATAVATMLSTGVAKSADEAFDVLAAGAREGVNRNEDLLDTFTEYPALFKKLGLSGEEALGLVSQGMEAGARNSDLAADALKEFQIRATDASESSAAGFEALGLNAEEMTSKIALGGESARDGLEEVLDRLRETEDPVKRNAAAVALFGTQAEDLGDALFAMDLSTAVDQLDGVTGAAQKMFETLNDNDATKMEAAQRNIEVAAEGIKGALAVAFSEPLGDFADWVSSHRGELMEFLLGLADGAIDFGISFIEGLATATEGVGTFVGSLADIVQMLGRMAKLTNPFADTSGFDELADQMRDFEDGTETGAEALRETMIPALEDTKKQLHDFADPQVALAYVHDAALETADAVGKVGVAAKDGSVLVDGFKRSQDGTVTASKKLREQLENAVGAMEAERDTADAAGESQDDLAKRYGSSRDALIEQMEQMGLTREEASKLIKTVEKTPKEKRTTYKSNSEAEKVRVSRLDGMVRGVPGSRNTRFDSNAKNAGGPIDRLTGKIRSVPRSRQTTINAVTSTAYNSLSTISNLIGRITGIHTAQVRVSRTGPSLREADGGVVEMMAAGGIRDLTPMAPIAQAVPANTWRVVGDRLRDREFYIPDDGSARSDEILRAAMASFGYLPVAGGAAPTGQAQAPSAGVSGADIDRLVQAVVSSKSVPSIEKLIVQAAGNDTKALAEAFAREFRNEVRRQETKGRRTR